MGFKLPFESGLPEREGIALSGIPRLGDHGEKDAPVSSGLPDEPDEGEV